jgi:hypothetical protein
MLILLIANPAIPPFAQTGDRIPRAVRMDGGHGPLVASSWLEHVECLLPLTTHNDPIRRIRSAFSRVRAGGSRRGPRDLAAASRAGPRAALELQLGGILHGDQPSRWIRSSTAR